MPGIIQEGMSTIFQNSTFQSATKEGLKSGFEYAKTQGSETAQKNVLQVMVANCLLVKNTYKLGSRVGVSILHLRHGGSVYYPPFMCNVASIGCSVAAVGCRVVDKFRPMGGLSLLADGLSICGDVMSKGAEDRPTIGQILM